MMERVAFLLEATGERLGCMLNPETLVVRRWAGIRPRTSTAGRITGAGLTDDPLIYTGGGRTELLIDLLFDVQIAGSTLRTDDVRDLTRPLWELAENVPGDASPPLVRFVWGKTWNIPGVVAGVAERLEQFTGAGAPLRSWLRIRLLRVSEAEAQAGEAPFDRGLQPPAEGARPIAEEDVVVHRVLGEGTAGDRLEDIAFVYYGDPSAWRVIAAFNGIDDPMRLRPGALLRIPPVSALGSRR